MKTALRALLLIGAALLAAAAHLSGLTDRESLEALFTGSPLWGPILFVALFSLLQPFGFPGLLFMATSTLIWPLGFAFLLNWAGCVGAGCVGFGFARFVGREWVERRLPARMRDFEARIQDRAFRTVLMIRLTTYLIQPAHWALGLSPVKFGPFLLATAMGFIPLTVFWTFAGGNALRWLDDQPRGVWLGAAAAILAVVLTLGIARRRRAEPQQPG